MLELKRHRPEGGKFIDPRGTAPYVNGSEFCLMNVPLPPAGRFQRYSGRNQTHPANAPPLPPGLDARSAAVLREIVEQYVATGEPVGSRTLARRLPMNLS